MISVCGKREVVLVPIHPPESPSSGPDKPALYAVRVRLKRWFLWSDWYYLNMHADVTVWSQDRANQLALLALDNGVVPGVYSNRVCPILELNEVDG